MVARCWFAYLAPIAVTVGGLARASVDVAPAEFGALRCFQQVTAHDGLSSDSALQLCFGATSEAPASCYAEARRRFALTSLDIVRLCRGAISAEDPAYCLLQLEAKAQLSTQNEVTYCGAQQLLPVTVGGTGDPACVEYALNRTDLSSLEAIQVCAGSRSTRPAACVEWGEDHTQIDTLKLVPLCAEVVWLHVPNATPPYPDTLPPQPL